MGEDETLEKGRESTGQRGIDRIEQGGLCFYRYLYRSPPAAAMLIAITCRQLLGNRIGDLQFVQLFRS